MVSRGHLLYCILLPLLAQVAADDADEQIVSEVISRNRESSEGTSGGRRPADSHPLPASLILHLLQSGVLQPPALPAPHHTIQDTDNDVEDETERNDESDNDSNDVVVKRVFCNGFTGCGGRHRDRSRRQERYGKRLIPVLVKRPFCNSFGCYNGKRSPAGSSPFSLVKPSETYRARLLPQMLTAALESARREGSVTALPGKRLFCNGYGGCRGGKRSLFSPWMSNMNGVVGPLR